MTGKLCCRNERAEEQSLFRRCPSLLSLTLMSVLLLPLSLQAADIRRSGEDTFIIQQQRQEALEQQLTPSAPDVRLSAPGSFAHKINFPVETPCFQIKQTELKGADALPHWLPLQKIANGAVGHCLGAKGINLLMSALQNRLVDHGYVTTRVLAPSQDLKSGILRLVIIPGVVRHVRLTPDSDDYIQLYSSFPAHEGSLLDLRGIEQGLENMQRLPGVQADMEIVPGEQPGESDILITRKQDKYWRLGFSLDDSGTRSTGRYLGGITFSLDNPFSLSDLLYVSATHNFPHYGGKGSKNYTAHYSVPFGYWQFSVTASDYDYHQTVAGAVIEAAGYLALSAGQINNVNDHFTTERVVVSTEKVTEYQLSGSDKRWSAGEPGVYVDNDSSNSLKKLHTPEGARDKFTQYDYPRTVEETRVKESDPGKILSGAGMTIVADKLLNDKSQVLAGGLLDMQAGDVENVSVSGERHVTDSGTSTYYYRIKKKGTDKQGESISPYAPPTVIQTITLKPGELTSHGQVQGSQVTLSPLKPQGTDVQTGQTGNVDAAVAATDRIPLRPVVSAGEPVILLPGQQFEVSTPQGSIHVAGPDTRLPDSSLFVVVK